MGLFSGPALTMTISKLCWVLVCLGSLTGASILIGFHNFVDFSLQIQDVTLIYVALLGLGWVQPQRSRYG
jgi:hypothetical protein